MSKGADGRRPSCLTSETQTAYTEKRTPSWDPVVDCCWASESIISALALRGVRFLGSGRVARDGRRALWAVPSSGR